MTVKSVIEIDVHDESFKQFAKLFEKYESLLKETPTTWAEAGKESAAVATSTALTVESLVAALLTQQKISEKIADDRKRAAAEAKRAAEEAKQMEFSWDKVASKGRDLARSTLSIARGTYDIGRTLLKWSSIGAIGAGLVGGGGLFGIESLAGGAGARRRSAQGLGVSIGEQQAFETNYGRLVDPNAVLSGVNQALTDATQRFSLYGAGLREQDLHGKNAAQVSAALVPLLKKLADQTPDSLLEQTIQARGLGNLGISVEDLQRLRRTPQSELNEFAGQYATNRRTLDLQDDVAKKWQDLDVRLKTAGRTIEAVFIRGLGPLTKPIEHLSESVTKALETFLKNPHLGEWIENFGHGLENAANYISSDKFQNDVKSFADNVGTLANKTVAALQKLGLISDPNNPDTPSVGDRARGAAAGTSGGAVAGGVIGGALGGPGGAAIGAKAGAWLGGMAGAALPNGVRLLGERVSAVGSPNWTNPGNIRFPGSSQFARFDSAEAGVRAVGRQVGLYETRDHLDTIAKIIEKYAPAKDHNNVKAYIEDVAKRTGFGADQHLNPTDINSIAKIVSAILQHENYSQNRKYTSQAVIKILDKTGGNVTVQTSQIAK